MRQLLTLLLGAVLGYASGWLKSHLDERRRRRAVATALLAEMGTLESSLAYLRDRWRGGKGVPALPSPMLDRFASELQLFAPLTVAHVLDVAGFLNEVRKGFEHVRASDNDFEKRRYVEELKGLCDDTLRRTELARQSLRSAGGRELPLLPPESGTG